jgi:transposase-like protein
MNDEADPPDPEVPERAKRRRFTAEYKARVLAEYEDASPGERGELLRREGLYSSHLSEWRKAAARGAAAGLDKKRGRRGPDARDRRIAKLEAENDRLRDELSKAHTVIDVQGKVSALLSDLSESAEDEKRSTK